MRFSPPAAAVPSLGSKSTECPATYFGLEGAAGVEQVVLVEASVGVPADKILESNRWMLETAAADRRVMSVVGKLDVSIASEMFAEQLDELAANSQFVGIRISDAIFNANSAGTFEDIQPNVLANLATAAGRGLTIDTMGISGAVLAKVGAAIPGIVFVMDHLAGKPSTFDIEGDWKADMEAALSYPSVIIKVSDVHKLSSQSVTGQPAGLKQFASVTDATPYVPVLQMLTETFGADRLVFGSNWPVSDAGTGSPDSVGLQIAIVEAFLANLAAGERDKVMFANALRLYAPHVA